MRFFATFGVFLLLATTAEAQLPTSNVYMFDLTQTSDSTFEFSKPRYLTAFNPNGYNNQPVFLNNNEIYLTVQMPTMRQPDIYALDLQRKTRRRVTKTASGEYSPKRAPDTYKFTAVRQEINGPDTTLRLWEFPVDQLSEGRPIFRYVTDIGYYSWLDSRRLALFIVSNPNYLGLATTDSDRVIPIATTVGRCFQRLPNGNLAYVQKNDFRPWVIMEKNLYREELQPQIVVNTLPNCEDFVVLPDGTFLMASGSKIYKYNKLRDADWREIVDFSYYRLGNITRMALSPDLKLAVVAE